MKRFVLFPIVLTPALAWGQSFNVDFNSGSGAGAGAPAMSFKGAAGQSGWWNSVGSQTTFTLAELDSAGSAVTLTRTGGGTIGNNSSAALAGDDEKLLEDAFIGSSGTTVTYTFNNLQAGTYALYTYAIDPASSLTTTVNVAGSTSQSNQPSGSFLSGPSYFVGATHALHVVTVIAGGSIAATLTPTGSQVEIAGFQLVRLPGSLLRMHVNDNAAGAGTGANWTDAFTSPVTALSTARVAGGQNCEVWVANGFYEPTTTTERFRSFDVPNHLKFYGGFAGTETQLSQRNTGNNLCYLNGDIGAAGNSDNSYTVVNADFSAADTIIDGFRIHNGYNNDGGVGGGQGGGMSLLSGSATVRNCTFVDNYASNYGAGVYAYNGAPTFMNCLFYQNESFAGAGLFAENTFPVRMYNCRFMDQYTFEGALHFQEADGLVANCIFTGNYAGGEGGAIHADGTTSQVTVAQCTIAGNAAGQVVGGIFAQAGADVTVQNTILWNNVDQFSVTTLEKQYDTSGVGSTITLAASTAEGAGGNPGLDPLFVDGNGADNTWGTFDDNVALQAASPCIDLAGNANVPADFADLDEDGNTAEQLPIDFNGDTRIRNVVVDRGAIEFQPDCNLDGDLDNSGAVDLSDLATLLGHFGVVGGGTPAHGDINGDGNIDLSDLAALLSNFGQSCP